MTVESSEPPILETTCTVAMRQYPLSATVRSTQGCHYNILRRANGSTVQSDGNYIRLGIIKGQPESITKRSMAQNVPF